MLVKLSIEQFIYIKNSLLNLISDINNRANLDIPEETLLNEFFEKYKNLKDELLSYDLSDIPFEEWKGLFIFSGEQFGGPADFSNTHANIDFSLIEGASFDDINLEGCNIKNLQKFDYNENTFDENYMINHPEFFPDKTLPQKVRNAFYEKKMVFNDLIEYPSLKNCVNVYSFAGDKYSASSILIDTIGFDHAIRLFDEYPEFVSAITNKNERELFLKSNYLVNKNFDQSGSYEEAKQFVYKEVIFSLKNDFSTEFLPPEIIPQDMVESLPNVFINEEELPISIIDKYYAGNISFDDAIKYRDILKDKDIELGTRSISGIKEIKRTFGDYWKFIDMVPKECYKVVQKYFSLNSDAAESISDISSSELNKLISDSIRFFFDYDVLGKKKFNIEELYVFSKYVPVDELILETNILTFIKKCGFDNIIEYNNSHNKILNQSKNDNYNSELLGIIANYNYKIDEYLPIENAEQFSNIFELLIHEARSSEDAKFNTFVKDNKNIMNKTYPNEFFDYDLIEEILKGYVGYKYDSIIKDIEKAINGNTYSLLSVLHDEPKLIQAFLNKRLIVSKDVYLYEVYNQVGSEKFIKMCSKYGKPLYTIFNAIKKNNKLEEMISLINSDTYEEQLNRYIYEYIHFNDSSQIDVRRFPPSFINTYKDLFLDNNAPRELVSLFYSLGIDPSVIESHPEWKQFLFNKNLLYSCDPRFSHFVRKCMALGLNNNRIFELYDKYGPCLEIITIEHTKGMTIDNLDAYITSQILDSILKGARYYESAISFLGSEHPELFLTVSAPTKLKDAFYNSTGNTPLSFKLLKENREFLPFLDGKNVLLSLKRGNESINELDELFKKYGDQEAIRIGMKNPESVMEMLSQNKLDLLSLWYEKLNFVPHHVVMIDFPFEESDKFISAGKKWSQLMRIEKHNVNEDAKSAILKASMCFGVFDNDSDGFNKIIELFSNIPKTLIACDIQKIIDHINEKISELGTSPNQKDLEKYTSKIELVTRCYEKIDENNYALRINQQQNPLVVKELRNIMEEAEVEIVLTALKSHKMFGGFEMRYIPEFRDFILKNMDTILTSPEYIAYISSIQKQWDAIKAFNSNRNLTLELAYAFVTTNQFTDVQIGNESLARASNMAGYSQEDFNVLQQIYNFGKTRTFSSIPRIYKETNGYTYETLRLDDPLALAIGTLTSCCQELDNFAETSMEHSMVDKHGRIIVIKDNEGNILAQSWVWRNKNVLCFDNIEIPERTFSRKEREGFTKSEFSQIIYNIYKESAEELIEKDAKEYERLLLAGKITEDQYESLKLDKVTIGMGYNDIAEALKNNATEDGSQIARPLDFNPPIKLTRKLYTKDSSSQYIVAGNEYVKSSNYDTPAIYPDEFIIYGYDDITQDDLIKFTRFGVSIDDNDYQQENYGKQIMTNIANNYGLDPKTTKIIINANFILIYDTKDEEIILGELLYNSSFDNQGQIVDYTDKLAIQIRNALEQIKDRNKEFNINRLNEEKKEMLNKAISLDNEIDEERGLTHGTR